MGLDMDLVRKRYVSPAERSKLKITGIKGIDIAKVTGITEDVIYWRKMNAIHKWFVDNVQEGNDDCKEYYVDKELLKKLLIIIQWVLAHKEDAEKVLPTQEGCFFGSNEYDEYYFEELKRTADKLREILKIEDEEGDYYYQSSW